MDSNDSRLPALAPMEWLIMTCVWDLGSANAREVSEQLQVRKQRALAPKTTGILLARLVEKGYLAASAERQLRGRALHNYTPLVPRQTALGWQLERFMNDHLLGDEDLELVDLFLEARRAGKV